MEHHLAVGGPGEAVRDLQPLDFALDLPRRIDAVEHPTVCFAFRSSMLPTQNAPSGPTRPSFRRVFSACSSSIRQISCFASVAGSNRSTLCGARRRSAPTRQVRSSRPRSRKSTTRDHSTRHRADRQCGSGYRRSRVVRPLVVHRALADPALQIGEAGEVERHSVTLPREPMPPPLASSRGAAGRLHRLQRRKFFARVAVHAGRPS